MRYYYCSFYEKRGILCCRGVRECYCCIETLSPSDYHKHRTIKFIEAIPVTMLFAYYPFSV